MTWPTHALLGINTVWLLTLLPPDLLGYDISVLCAVATLGALMPDLDASQSKIKHLDIPNTTIKPFLPVAQLVNSTDQHRGLLHSLWGIGIVCVFTLPLWFLGAWSPSAAFVFSYSSHLLGDSATNNGIRLLSPHTRRFYLLPYGWRFTTGSLAEEVLFAPLTLFCFALLIRSLLQA